MMHIRRTTVAATCCGWCLGIVAEASLAADRPPLEEVVVLAPYETTVDPALVPANVQRATAEQLQRSQSLDLTDFLNRQFSSVSINHAQNNPLQPDVNFRGFTASPLLGLPQGLSVYQNGVRINEPFGDAINWDLIPMSAIDTVQMLAGAQPVFGLNTLGGALSMQMKNGFNYEGTQAEAYGGSMSRLGTSIQAGGNDGRWGFYGDADYFEEDGWRIDSKSNALRLYGAVSLHESDWTVDLSAAYANTELRGNGPAPIELLAIDRAAVFTHPDVTENEHGELILEGSRSISDSLKLSGNAFYRRLNTDTFNGDATMFGECEVGDDEFLVEEDFDDVDGDGAVLGGRRRRYRTGASIPRASRSPPNSTTANLMRSTTSAGASRRSTAAPHRSACSRHCSAATTISRSVSPTSTAKRRSTPPSKWRACWRIAPRREPASSRRTSPPQWTAS